MSILKLGLNHDISNEDYHADREYVSSSSLKLMNKCPREFYKKYIKGEEEDEDDKGKDNPNLVFGSFLHSIVLEPELVQSEYAIFDGGRKAGKAWQEFKASDAAQGKTIVTKSQEAKAYMLKDVMSENKEALSLLENGVAEQTLCVEIEGVKIKVRADFLNEGRGVVDLKTTGNGVTYEEVQQTIMQWDYALSAALYADAFTQFTGEKHDFYFIFLAKNQMGCEVYKASDSMIEFGRKKYMKAIKAINAARESGHWFNNGIMEISLPEGI